MKALYAQIVKFGLTGVLCTLIDYVCYALCLRLGIGYMTAGVIGFTVSVTVNYILSMRWVFDPREDLAKETRFVIFLVLSMIGLALHEALLYVLMEYIWPLAGILSRPAAERVCKIVATGAVMVYNFVTRKKFLEKKETDV